jgi:hypothetical protein
MLAAWLACGFAFFSTALTARFACSPLPVFLRLHGLHRVAAMPAAWLACGFAFSLPL